MVIERTKLHAIADLVTQLVAEDGFICLDAEWEVHTRTLRLFMDHANGVTLDECARISNVLVESPALEEVLPGEYNLEISSPGIERPIRTIEHFQLAKNEGFQVDVKLTEKFKNRRKGVGTVIEISADDMISMKTTEGLWTFPWHMVLKATKVVDWDKVQERPI